MQNKKKEIWITNISTKQDISLGDLHLTVRRGQSYNLLDSKHFYYTEDEIKASIATGSIFKKSSVIKVRENEPKKYVMKIEMVNLKNAVERGMNTVRVVRKHIPLEKLQYDDLDFKEDNIEQNASLDHESDEKYAAEMAEIDTMDHRPALMVDQKLKDMDKEE